MEQLDEDKEALISQFHEKLRFVYSVDDMFPPDDCGDRSTPDEPNPQPPLEKAVKIGHLTLVT